MCVCVCACVRACVRVCVSELCVCVCVCAAAVLLWAVVCGICQKQVRRAALSEAD